MTFYGKWFKIQEMEEQASTASQVETKSSYGKRPLWQWILIYIVIAAVLYGVVYYFVFAKKGGGTGYNTVQTQYPTQAVSPTTTQSNTAPSSNIYTTKTDPTKGQYVTDFAGMTLYIFDKDTKGVSSCNGACATTWPPYTSGATAQSQFPLNITVITRTDGSKQFAWKSMPLYYYASDKKAGDMLGDGIGGIWHIVKP